MTRTQKWVLAITSTAALMVALDQLVVSTALNAIRNSLHASLATLEWTANAYSLSFAVLLITGAALGDRFGRRRMFVVGLSVFSLASAACALAPDTGALIAARAVQGAGSALVMPLAVALLTSAFPVEKRGRALGIFTALSGLAVVGGPLVGGAVTEGISWQWIFWINVPIGAVLIPLALIRTSESHGSRARPDLLGLALVSAGMLGLVWGLVRANAVGWGSAEVVSALATGAAMTVAFAVWETRAREPMLPVGLFADRAFTGGNIAMFLFTATLFSSVFFLAQYLQISLGYSPLGAGLRFLPWTLPLFVVAPVAGRALDRIGSRLLLSLGLLLQFAGLGWVAFTIAAALLRLGGPRARDRRLRRQHGHPRRAERRHERRATRRDRQGIRRLQHGPAAWRGIRYRHPRRRLRGQGRLRERRRLPRPRRTRARRRGRHVSARRDRRPPDAPAPGSGHTARPLTSHRRRGGRHRPLAATRPAATASVLGYAYADATPVEEVVGTAVGGARLG